MSPRRIASSPIPCQTRTLQPLLRRFPHANLPAPSGLRGSVGGCGGYYMRLMIYVTPRRALFWPTRDFASSPEELDLSEVRRVG